MIGASVGSAAIALWNLTPTAIHRGITLRCLLPSSLPFTTILLDSIEATVNPSSYISPPGIQAKSKIFTIHGFPLTTMTSFLPKGSGLRVSNRCRNDGFWYSTFI